MDKLGNANVRTDTLAAEYLAAAPDAILAVDPAGIITLANQQAYAQFGYEAITDELIGLSVDQLVPSRIRAGHGALRASYSAKGQRRHMGDSGSAVHAQRKDGTLIPVEIALSPVSVGDSRGTIAVIRDQREQLLAKAEAERVQQTLDAIGDAIFFLDPTTLDISHINNGAKRQTGYDREELTTGMALSDLDPAMTAQDLQTILAPLVNAAVPVMSQATVFRAKDGREFPVEIVYRYSCDSHGMGEKVMAAVRDVTEIQELEERARSSEEFYHVAFQGAPTAMVVTSRVAGNDIIVNANDSFHTLLGFVNVDLVGMRLADFYADDAKNIAGTSDHPLVERQYRHRDGHHIWTSTQSSILQNPEGETVTFSRIEDITRRVTAERQRDQRQLMLAALSRIHKAIVNDQGADKMLRTTIEIIGDLFQSDHSFIATPLSTDNNLDLKYRSMSSNLTADESGRVVPMSAVIDEAVASGLVVSVDEFTEFGPTQFGPGLCAPVVTSTEFVGIIVVARRPGSEPFTADDITLARALASEVALTVNLGRTRAERRQAERVRERKTVARELQAAGLQRLSTARDGLRGALDSAPPGLRTQAEEIAAELSAALDVVRDAAVEITAADDSVVNAGI